MCGTATTTANTRSTPGECSRWIAWLAGCRRLRIRYDRDSEVLWDHDWRKVTARPFSSAERVLTCLTHLLQGGRPADLAAIDPQGPAATVYAFLDEAPHAVGPPAQACRGRYLANQISTAPAARSSRPPTLRVGVVRGPVRARVPPAAPARRPGS
jgi:hypothetical protein